MATSKHTVVSGIYVILNTKNNKIYLGKASNIRERWQTHKSHLNLGRHYNKHLQRAWNKYGAKAFKFLILERCDIAQLDERERHHIAIYKARGMCYNMTDGGGGIPGMSHTEETRAKIRASKIGEKNPNFGKTPSEETRKKLSAATSGENNPSFGKKRSPEFCARMSEIKKGKKASPETRAKMSEMRKGERNPRFGAVLSPETRAKISASEKGKIISEESRAKMSEGQKRRHKREE